MANDGQIVFEVTADGKHAIADIKEITRAIQQETGKWDDAANKSANNIESNFSGVLKKLVAGFSAVKIGKALLDIGKDAISAASDLQEVQNVVDTTFGSGASRIDTWAKNAGTQFGLTETQAKRFTSTLGAMMKSSGLAGEEIVGMSTDLAGLAADMASFYNLDFDTAFQKIRSGISGETEPLKQLGINMSVANLNAFALQQGLEKTFDKMTQGEQTMLRYQYLMQATADAQGDFSRTSDGYANSVRKLQTNIDNLKTTLGKTFIDAAAKATGAINEFIGSLTPDESKKTVLDDFAEIDQRTEAKIAEIKKIKDEADATASVLREIYGNGVESEQGTEAADVISKFGVNSAEAQEYLKGLGFSTEEINSKQQDWLETCKRLVQTIPGLSSIINTETGEVKGGTQAVYDYIKAWEEGQTKLAMLGALEQKEAALSSRFANIPELQLDKALADRRARQFRDNLNGLYEKYGMNRTADEFYTVTAEDRDLFNISAEDYRYMVDAVSSYESALAVAEKATQEYQNQVDALDEAKAAMDEYRAAVDEMGGTATETKSEVDAFWEANADGAKTAVSAANMALAELEDYVEGVRKATAEAVNSVAKGLDGVDFSRFDPEKVDKVSKLTASLANAPVGSDKWKEINAQITELNKGLVTTNSIFENLESQSEFLDSYLANLKAARNLGISDELLAELSDGSVESAQYLDAIVNDKTGKTAKEIDDKYKEIQEKKAALSSELANQQLTVDETYQNLAAKAKEAVAALDLQGEATENTGKTVAGIAQGIADHVSDVSTQVDAIIAELDRLNGYGINIDFGGFGSIHFTTSTGAKAEGSGRMGIPLVPHDDYIARLHEGERVLTAQENQIWNALRNGGIAGFDLETLGGVMRDNVQAGGNVYLDGRTVGHVISDQQGKSYRQLQRSGWQA